MEPINFFLKPTVSVYLESQKTGFLFGPSGLMIRFSKNKNTDEITTCYLPTSCFSLMPRTGKFHTIVSDLHSVMCLTTGTKSFFLSFWCPFFFLVLGAKYNTNDTVHKGTGIKTHFGAIMSFYSLR